MKKILKIMMALMVTAMCVTGCSKEEEVSDKESQVEDNSEKETDKDDKDDSNENDDNNQTVDVSDNSLSGNKCLFDESKSIMYLIDLQTDTITCSYDYGNTLEEFFEADDEISYWYVLTAGNEECDSSEIAVNVNFYSGESCAYIYDVISDSGIFIDDVDMENVYYADIAPDNNVYLVGASYGENGYEYSEYAYEYDLTSGTFDAIDGYSDFYDAIKGNYDIVSTEDSSNSTASAAFRKNGYCLAVDQEGILVYLDETGTVQYETNMMRDDLCIYAYDDEYIFFRCVDEDYSILPGLYVYSIEESEIMPISDKNVSSLDLIDGYYYYAEVDNGTYGMPEYDYCEFNETTVSVNYIDHIDYVAGRNDYSGPIMFDADYCGGTVPSVFYGTQNDDSLNLSVNRFDGTEYFTTDLGEVYHYEYTDLGTIVGVSYTNTCDDCGFEIMKYYGEVFELSDMYDNADVINEYLQSISDESYAYVESYAMGTDCSTHIDEYYFENSLYETVTDVRAIGNHYIEVDISGYEYSGGAHGYPYDMFCLFDLSTGDRVNFEDIYSGTEEDFKETVANKAVEMFENSEYGFYEQDDDSIYDSVYESVSFELAGEKYDDEGLYVVLPVYTVGPYASGEFYAYITYDELGITAFDN